VGVTPPIAVEPVSFISDLFDTAIDVFGGAGQTILRSVVPDPIEAAIQVLFPETGAQVFGSPVGPQSPFILGTIPDIAPGGGIFGSTPPFFPSTVDQGPPGTIGRFEDEFPGQVSSPVVDGRFDIPPPTFVPGVIPDQPGIADDLGRAAIDIIPELIPDFLGGGIGGAIAGAGARVLADRLLPANDDFAFEDPFMNPIPTGDPTVAQCVTLPAVVDYQTWVSAGRPSGFTANPCDGLLHRKRRRRRRPLSQQAKDDLAWAKATFGAGKQFDAVVSRMRF